MELNKNRRRWCPTFVAFTSEGRPLLISFLYRNHLNGFVLVNLIAFATFSGEWISVKKVTPDPDFVRVGQSLKIRLNIEDLHLDRWNTTGYWVYAPDFSERSPERALHLVRQLGSSSEVHFSYDTRVSRERYIDLVVKNVTLADSGVYRCKFRRPPHPWSIRVEFRVIVEGETTC